MSERTFHHGNLRSVLLDEAEETLRRDGVDGLSLRQLAKAAGVSHSAPRRHFPDRQSLLTALAERGLRRLTRDMETALREAPDNPRQRFHAAAKVFVGHAVHNGAMSELIFTVKPSGSTGELDVASKRFAAVVQQALPAVAAGSSATPGRRQMLVAATLQGVAGFIAAERIDAATVDQIIEDAAELFTR